jgi:hypothetical protein
VVAAAPTANTAEMMQIHLIAHSFP